MDNLSKREVYINSALERCAFQKEITIPLGNLPG